MIDPTRKLVGVAFVGVGLALGVLGIVSQVFHIGDATPAVVGGASFVTTGFGILWDRQVPAS